MSGQVSGVPAAARFVEHARRYSELGWALVRLDGKVPKGKDWQQERPDPSPEHAAGLWSQWGKRWNMGVVLGTSGLVVVEYDTDEAGTKLKELLGGELPLTPIAQTGRGRLHLYFKDAGLSKGARDGLELRAGPHQCVLPPSVHPETGQAYRWMDKLEPWTVALGDVPAAVLAYFADERRNGAAPPLPEVIRIGEIDRTLASLAGSMRRRNADEEAIYVALVETLKRCEPGHTHTEDDCRRIARSIAKKAPGEAAKVSIPPSIATESGVNETLSAGELPFAPLAPLLENVPPEPPWFVRGYLAPYAVTLLAGRPKVGKSTLCCALLAKVAAGELFIGLQTSVAGVLLLTEERRDTLAEKARILELVSFRQGVSPKGGANELAPVHALMRHDAGATPWPEVVRQAMAYCTQHGLTVLVIDTFDRWVGLRGDAENAAGAVNEALEPLQYAAAAGLPCYSSHTSERAKASSARPCEGTAPSPAASTSSSSSNGRRARCSSEATYASCAPSPVSARHPKSSSPNSTTTASS
jgi:hypothetical protein